MLHLKIDLTVKKIDSRHLYLNDDLIHILQIGYVFYNPADSGAVQLKSDNIDSTLGKFP